MVNFLKYKKLYFVFSSFLITASLASLFIFGLNPGIDFTGGSILELSYEGGRPAQEGEARQGRPAQEGEARQGRPAQEGEARQGRPSIESVRKTLSDFGSVYVQTAGNEGLVIRMKDISEETHQLILSRLGEGYKIEERRFESIGPTIGQELKGKTKVLVIIALLSILIYIAFAFRKVQRPIASWQYGIASLIALFHDVLIPLGVFSVLGKFYGVQITIPVVAALLTVLGYSINNTVVVFDRIRENLIRGTAVTFEETVDKSLNQTLTRCLNTSLTTLLVLVAIYFFGGATLQYFSLALIIGVAAGTYSSLFLASPLLVSYLTRFKKYA